ncbi:MAG: hypothetical protein LBB29_03025 [Holosporaceae bacterium]|jgi:hypothetical protein|nr:hypothetical protein [Holosporaceae bacterium]
MRLFHDFFSFYLIVFLLEACETASAFSSDVAEMPDLLSAYRESVLKFPASAASEGISPKELLRWMYFNLHRLELYLKSTENDKDSQKNDFLDSVVKSKKSVLTAAQYLDREMEENEDNFKISANLINHIKTAFESYGSLRKKINEKYQDFFQILPIPEQNVVDFCYRRITADMIRNVKNNIKMPVLIEELQRLQKQLEHKMWS